MDIPRIFTIAESRHRIHNPISSQKLIELGECLDLRPGIRMLDLGSGSGELLCLWAKDFGISGKGVDLSPLFTEQARRRAEELGVADRVEFLHGDAAGFVEEQVVDVAACIGATWIGGGFQGTVGLLRRSLRDGGILLIGEPYWLQTPTEEEARGCGCSASDFLTLPELLQSLMDLGCDVVGMVLASPDDWDRYEARKWIALRRWLDANPSDAMAEEVRGLLRTEPLRLARFTRRLLGWGIFALMPR
ncbi:MAG: methyltransferase domain-containing protein [Fimbriimonadales bacterium]